MKCGVARADLRHDFRANHDAHVANVTVVGMNPGATPATITGLADDAPVAVNRFYQIAVHNAAAPKLRAALRRNHQRRRHGSNHNKQ